MYASATTPVHTLISPNPASALMVQFEPEYAHRGITFVTVYRNERAVKTLTNPTPEARELYARLRREGWHRPS